MMKTASAALFAVVSSTVAVAREGCTDDVCLDDNELDESGLLQLKAKQQLSTESKWLASNFVKYYNYDGDLRTTGTVFTTGVSEGTPGTTGQNIWWTFTGADPRCVKGPGIAGNSCGVHIHEGKSCTDNALGHYWNKDVLLTDPWSYVSYTSTPNGDTTSVLVGKKVLTGLTEMEVRGHAFIVHDFEGARIACALLGNTADVDNVDPPSLAEKSKHTEQDAPTESSEATSAVAPRYFYLVRHFVPYVGYTGDLDVQGTVTIKAMMTQFLPTEDSLQGQLLSWELTGVDPECSTGPSSDYGNSCGIHIHNANSASDPCGVAALGHAWKTGALNVDPWAHYSYTSVDGGASVRTAMVDQPVYDGFSTTEITGKVMVVHDFYGNRTACGEIN